MDDLYISPEELRRVSLDLEEREITDVSVSPEFVIVEALHRNDPATDYQYATWQGKVTLYHSSNGLTGEIFARGPTEVAQNWSYESTCGEDITP